jgi:hypothetical protein
MQPISRRKSFSPVSVTTQHGPLSSRSITNFRQVTHLSLLNLKAVKPSFTPFVALAMFTNLLQTRIKHKHTRLPQRDSESLDSDNLLPSDPSNTSLPLKTSALDRSARDLRVAVKTLVICSIVYLGVGLWLGLSVRDATVVSDADDFCMHHVSRFC